MKGGRLIRIGEIQVRDDYPEPQITHPDQVKIRVRYAAVNADDYNAFRGVLGKVYADDALFHEMSGEIVQVGPLAAELGFRVGDRVSRNVLKGCGACPMCRKGKGNLCTELSSFGASSEYIVCNANSVVKLPDDISLEEGALYWLTATCTRCIERLAIQPGSSVLIMGGGATGLTLLQLVMKRMPSFVMLSEPFAPKRALAKKLGASIVIDPTQENILERSLEVTMGAGFDVVIDAAGTCSALENAAELLCRGGKLMLFSNYRVDEYIHLSLMDMYWKEYTIYSSYGASDSSYTGIQANTLHHFNIKVLIDRVLPLSEMQKALELYGSGSCLRLLLRI